MSRSSFPPIRNAIFMSHAQEGNLEGGMDKQAVLECILNTVLPHTHHLKGQPPVSNNSISNETFHPLFLSNESSANKYLAVIQRCPAVQFCLQFHADCVLAKMYFK